MITHRLLRVLFFSLALGLVSQASFAATPALTLDYPRGGEAFVAGTLQQVALGPKPKVTPVNVELSLDGGATFTALGSIAVVKSVAQPLNFTVPNTPSGNCVIRVSGTLKTVKVSAASRTFAIVGAGTTGTSGLTDGSVTNPKLAGLAVSNDKVSSGAASPNMALTADGAGNANWSPLSFANLAGTVGNAQLTNPSLTVVAGTGLTGGGLVSLGGMTTLSLGSNLTLGETTTGTFSGNGSALTNLSTANLTGTLGNAQLVNSSLTVSAGTGLTGGGLVPLGGSTTLSLGSNLTLGGTTTGTFSGDGSGLTGVIATSTARTPQQIALLKWGVGQANISVGTNPRGICFDGASIWVANYGSSNVTKLNASTGALIGTYSVGSAPYGICFDGANIWVTNVTSNNVTKLNASTGALIGTYSVGSAPYGICFDGANIWVTNSNSNNVTKLNASTGAFIGTYSVGSTPVAICFDGANIWVTNVTSNNVTKLNASTGALIGTYSVGSTPYGICFDGASIWVAKYSSDNVTKLSASTGAAIGTYSVGSTPVAICFDGANIWVTNSNSNNVTKLNASTGALIGTYSVGSAPYGICFDGANIWVTNSNSNNVTKL